jgi:peroxiredoxin
MYYFNRGMCLLVVMLFVIPTGTYASSWSCARKEHIREVIIEYTGSGVVPCRVVYSKPTEGLETLLLWTSENVTGYCEKKTKAFIEKLEAWEWVCSDASEVVASYKQSLNQYMEKSKKEKSPFSASDQAVMGKANEELAKAMPDPGIKVGEKAPDFILNNAFGKSVSLRDKLMEGPVVLVFYRGAWCPFCNMHLHALQESLPEFKKYGAQLITITPQTPDKSVEQFKDKGNPFEVLSDLNSKVMKDYNLYFELPADLVEVYKKHGLDVEAFNGKGRAVLPIPGSFVIDSDGIVRAMHADTDYKTRMEPSTIVNALRIMQRKAE